MENTSEVLVVGYSKVNEKSMVSKLYENFCLVFIIDTISDKILGVDAAVTLEKTREFIQKLFLEESMLSEEKIKEKISERYHGPLKKSIFMAYKNALKIYNSL